MFLFVKSRLICFKKAGGGGRLLQNILEEDITKEEIIYKLHFFPSKFINKLLDFWIYKKITYFLCYKNNSLTTGVLPLSE